MNADTAKNLDRLQDMTEIEIRDLISKETDPQRMGLLTDVLEFHIIARRAIEGGNLDMARRALECARARIEEVSA